MHWEAEGHYYLYSTIMRMRIHGHMAGRNLLPQSIEELDQAILASPASQLLRVTSSSYYSTQATTLCQMDESEGEIMRII